MTASDQVARRPQQNTQVASASTAGQPAWLIKAAQDMAEQGIPVLGAVPDMGGVRIPQVSVDGNVFTVRFGKDDSVTVGDGLGMNFVIVRAAGKYEAHRRYYDTPYDPQAQTPGNLVCWSTNSKTPDDTVAMKQSATCQNCPVFKDCGGSWPALVWIIDDNYTGPARWNMNFNTRRNAPVLPTINKNYHTASWYSLDQFLDVVAKNPAVGIANLVLRAEFDRGKDVVKGKCIVCVVDTTPSDHTQAIAEIEADLFDVVFRPVIMPRAEHEIEGKAQATAPAQRQAPKQAAQAPKQAAPAQRQIAPARHVEDAQVVDEPAARQAPRQAPRQGVPQGTEDDMPQAQAPRQAPRQAPVQRQAPQAQAPQAQASQAPRSVFGRAPPRPAAGPLANRRPAPAPQQDQGMDDAGDEGYAQ